MRCDPGQMVATYTSANTYLFDLETSKQVLTIETKQNSGEINLQAMGWTGVVVRATDYGLRGPWFETWSGRCLLWP